MTAVMDGLALLTGSTVEMGDERLPERFWRRVEVGALGCWVWTGARTRAGYSSLRWGDETVYGHRLAYEVLVGPVPDGLQIDHLCRTRACVRPDHLEAVTQVENVRRGDACRPQERCRRGLHRLAETAVRCNGGSARRCGACLRDRRRRRAVAS